MKIGKILSAVILHACCLSAANAQNTVGLTQYTTGNANGYVLFSPMTSTNTYLIDKCGEKVHEWNTSAYKPALSCFLLQDGSLLKTGQLDNPFFDEGGSGGMIERFDWNGTLLWNYSVSDSSNCQHHDIMPLPNGNILCIVWDRKSKQEAVLNGKDSSYNQSHLLSEKIIELQPIGTDSAIVVWEWKLWDHLIQSYDNTKLNYGVVSDHPELVNINYFPGAGNSPDWIHLNSIDYNPVLDQILVSSHTFNEVWIIDRSTTTAEAAAHSGGNSGRGGDILYRWGNPQAYQRGNPSTKIFFGQHHATWIPQGYPNAGKILVFNNGLNRPGTYSSIDMIEPPLNLSNTYDVPASTAFLPTNLFWTYTANTPSDFYSSNISGIYPLSNGSLMATSGTKGLFFEIDSMKQTLWSYVNPVTTTGILSQGNTPSNNLVFRCNFYEANYPGLFGQALTPQGEIELNPATPSICDTFLTAIEMFTDYAFTSVYPNPFTTQLTLSIADNVPVTVSIYDFLGHQVFQQSFTNSTTIDTDHLVDGIYLYELHNESGRVSSGKMIKQTSR
ncbi:MAG TPA: aryl-sulfate sulfotransferase [Chitinophagales bacterium]|nr:aryl-sulfate sulfotransferase [Chitinophagales bacterium]